MPVDEPHAREMSTLTGTARTLERAVHGMTMTAARLRQLLADDAAAHGPPSAGVAALLATLDGLTTADRDVVDAILSGRDRPTRAGR